MNPNAIRATATGVTAGVTAGIVLVAGVIAWDEYDPWDKAKKAIARRRLTPAERETLDRLRHERHAAHEWKQRVHQAHRAQIREKYQPHLLPAEYRGYRLDELPTVVLINQLYRLTNVPLGVFWDQRAALLDEFDRRNSWEVKRGLSEADQLRLLAVVDSVNNNLRYRPPARTVTPPVFPCADNERYWAAGDEPQGPSAPDGPSAAGEYDTAVGEE